MVFHCVNIRHALKKTITIILNYYPLIETKGYCHEIANTNKMTIIIKILYTSIYQSNEHGCETGFAKMWEILMIPRTVENTGNSREILGNKVQLHIIVLHT